MKPPPGCNSTRKDRARSTPGWLDFNRGRLLFVPNQVLPLPAC
jgi:hypothetical protein